MELKENKRGWCALEALMVKYLHNIYFPQRASFSLRVSVMKAKNLMAKDANGKSIQTQIGNFLIEKKKR